MKPKLFIGSSKESLPIAYAIQNNLTIDVEATVWDQGVFTLSNNILESIINKLNNTDFGVFVFGPDDIIKLKKKNVNKARDNVVFELGLFIGKLGRNRCFMVVSNQDKISLPTDLSGIIYAQYDANRSDGNLAASLGPACNQIRNEISKLGFVENGESTNENSNLDEKTDTDISEIKTKKLPIWIDSYIKKEYEQAIVMLKEDEKNLKNDQEKYINDLFKVLSKNKISPSDKEKNYASLFKKYRDNINLHLHYLRELNSDSNYLTCLKLADEYLKRFPSNEEIVLLKVDALIELGKHDLVIKELVDQIEKTQLNEKLILKLFNAISESEKSDLLIKLLHYGFINLPNNEKVLYEYFKYFESKGENEKCLFLIEKLIDINKTATYLATKGNILLNLNFYNTSMDSYMEASEVSNRKEKLDISQHRQHVQKQVFI